MDSQDRRAIEELFGRLGEVERQAGPRDADAEAFIRRCIGEQPGAPYFMAQTIVMQTAALEAAQRRIEELERQAPSRSADTGAAAGAGPWAGILGARQGAAARGGSLPAAGGGGRGSMLPASSPAPAAGAAAVPAARGGGFLAGAAQTAMGVAGGVLLDNALMGMFGGNPAAAAEPAPAEDAPADETGHTEEPRSEEGGGFFDSLFGGGDDEQF